MITALLIVLFKNCHQKYCAVLCPPLILASFPMISLNMGEFSHEQHFLTFLFLIPPDEQYSAFSAIDVCSQMK